MNPLNPVIKEEILDNTDIVIKSEPPDNIKEKLTNHLKRRQRSDDITTPYLSNISTAQIESPSALKLIPKKLSKLTSSKKNKILRSISNIETMSTSKLQSLPSGGHTNNMSNSGSVNNSNDEEKYGPHDGQTSAATSPTEKSKTPDIITTVLNHKRMSLLQDPDVVRFLENVSKTKRIKIGK